MKEKFSHSMSLLMALLVLVASQNLSINSHYCGNILVDKALVKPAKKCSMHDAFVTYGDHDKQEKNNCCDDQTEFIYGVDELVFHTNSIEMPQPIVFVAFVFNFVLPSIQDEVATHRHIYPPPHFLAEKDLLALHQVYLI